MKEATNRKEKATHPKLFRTTELEGTFVITAPSEAVAATGKRGGRGAGVRERTKHARERAGNKTDARAGKREGRRPSAGAPPSPVPACLHPPLTWAQEHRAPTSPDGGNLKKVAAELNNALPGTPL